MNGFRFHAIVFMAVLLPAVPYGVAQTYDRVIEDQDITSTLYLEYESNVLIRNCTVHNTGDGQDGIFLRGVSNVRITNCRIYDIDGKAGIRSSIYASSDSILIDSNVIYDIRHDGIMIPQRSQDDPPTTNTNVRIVGNHIYDTGLDDAPDYPTHAVYCQAPDFVIEGNVITGTRYGNGLSVRSSGIVRGNTVSGTSTSNRSPIRYFSDHFFTGPSDTLLIENNMVVNDGSVANAIDIYDYAPLYADDGDNAHVVKHFNIRFNTAVSVQSNAYAVAVADYYDDTLFSVQVDGNLAVNTRNPDYIYTGPDAAVLNGNYTTTTLVGFADTVAPYDLHLAPGHAAAGLAAGVANFPATDIDGDPRVRESLDPGADQTTVSSVATGPGVPAAVPGIAFAANPCKGRLDVRFSGVPGQRHRFRILDARGIVVAAGAADGTRGVTVDVAGYSPGVYLFDNGGFRVRTFLVR